MTETYGLCRHDTANAPAEAAGLSTAAHPGPRRDEYDHLDLLTFNDHPHVAADRPRPVPTYR